jgi:hypothetical protein
VLKDSSESESDDDYPSAKFVNILNCYETKEEGVALERDKTEKGPVTPGLKVCQEDVKLELDTGAAVSIISRKLAKKNG